MINQQSDRSAAMNVVVDVVAVVVVVVVIVAVVVVVVIIIVQQNRSSGHGDILHFDSFVVNEASNWPVCWHTRPTDSAGSPTQCMNRVAWSIVWVLWASSLYRCGGPRVSPCSFTLLFSMCTYDLDRGLLLDCRSVGRACTNASALVSQYIYTYVIYYTQRPEPSVRMMVFLPITLNHTHIREFMPSTRFSKGTFFSVSI